MRVATGGILVAIMVALTLVSDITNHAIPAWTAGIVGWCMVCLLFVDVKKSQRYQTVFIALAGVGLLIFGQVRDGHALWSHAIGSNTGLVTMLASVGFLRLIAIPAGHPSADKPSANNKPGAVDKSDQQLPVGFGAYIKTLAGVCLFGAVINISAPIIFSDLLYKRGALPRLASQSITRIFTATSTWSPFFGGMAAVLTNVPDMRISFAMLACLPFVGLSFLVVVLEVRLRFWNQIKDFKGYPVNFYNLWIPAALTMVILILHKLFPAWSVLSHISVSALLLTAAVLLAREGKNFVQTLARFVVEGLPTMINELQLFLAAGILAAGLVTVISGGHLPELFGPELFGPEHFGSELSGFTASSAAMLLGVMILLAVAGVHPVVTVSSATPLLVTLNPAPDLLAVCYLLAWGLGTCASPLSGTHLVFQGRYEIPSWKGAFWNWPYVLVMYGVAVVLLHVVEHFV